jgi:phosphoenolpyruvate carboxykinase (ATP)
METLLKKPNMKTKDLTKYGLKDTNAHWNLSPEELQAITLEKGMGKETNNGTLAINTGKFTGRSPQDRFLVKDDYTKDRVWWGKQIKVFLLKTLIICKAKSKNTLAVKKFLSVMVLFVLIQNIEWVSEQ